MIGRDGERRESEEQMWRNTQRSTQRASASRLVLAESQPVGPNEKRILVDPF